MTRYTMNSEAGVKELGNCAEVDSGRPGQRRCYNGEQRSAVQDRQHLLPTHFAGVPHAAVNQATLDENAITTLSLPFPSSDGVPRWSIWSATSVCSTTAMTRKRRGERFIDLSAATGGMGPEGTLCAPAHFRARASSATCAEMKV